MGSLVYGFEMSRQLNPLAIVRILDALNIRRQAALLALPYASEEAARRSARAHSATTYTRQLTSPLTAEKACDQLVELAIARAVELRSSKKEASTATKSTAPVPSSDASSLMKPCGNSAHDNKTETNGSGRIGSHLGPTPRAEIGAALEGRRLQGLSLDGLRFTASFNRSDLSKVSLKKCYAANSTFNLARLNDADLSGSQLHSCTFVNTEARHVNAVNCRFSHCQFKQCDLRSWDVRGAVFFRCGFTLSDLCGWAYDGRTVVIEPVDWSRCRRLAWHVRSQLPVGDCRVTGKGTEDALSLPPAAKPRRHDRRNGR